MKKRKLLSLIILVIILVLELLPYGAVMSYTQPEVGTMTKTLSCFSLISFRQGNVYPLITAILTCIMLVLSLIYFVKPIASLGLIMKAILLVSILTSIAPIRYLLYSVGSGAISALLIAEYFLTKSYFET